MPQTDFISGVEGVYPPLFLASDHFSIFDDSCSVSLAQVTTR